MSIKVVKFGGSSLADASQIKKSADIIKAESDRKYVIPSAPGKRYSDDIKITDRFYKCFELASEGKSFDEEFSEIMSRYDGIISELGISLSLENEYAEIKNRIANREIRDFAASRGEYLNGKIMAEYLGFAFIDSAEVITFDNNGVFMLDITIEKLRARLKGIEYAVIPGFYGASVDGTVRTFSRGGSDVTGSIVANAVKASIYENWTDVSGFLVADPRVVHNPEVIKAITYRELRELSYMGATVLHEDAIFPVRTAGIPINIRNTNLPLEKGTMIVPDSDCKEIPPYTITGIAGKKGFSVINIEKAMMNSEMGFGRKVLHILENNGISFEHMPSGIDTMSIIINAASIEGKEETVISEIRRAVNPDHVEIESGLALLAVVGRGMRRTRGTAARIFAALSHARVNVKMIDQGSSELNIIIGVGESDFEESVRKIYDIFVMTEQQA